VAALLSQPDEAQNFRPSKDPRTANLSSRDFAVTGESRQDPWRALQETCCGSQVVDEVEGFLRSRGHDFLLSVDALSIERRTLYARYVICTRRQLKVATRPLPSPSVGASGLRNC